MHIQRISCNYLQDKNVNRYSNNNRVSFERDSSAQQSQPSFSGLGNWLINLYYKIVAELWGLGIARSAKH